VFNSANTAPPPPATAAETAIRQLVANGKSKAALEQAKEFHKKQNTAASERLLIDAYAARIQSLLEHNLDREAQALIGLVRERYPAAKSRLDGIGAAVAARTAALEDWIGPLNDPQAAPEQRQAVEHAVRTQVSDLAALAACQTLPPEHPLRQAAAALDRAFQLVTSGPVPEDLISLPEVSRRSPLAPWKLLVRGIAAYYRGEEEACREQLDAIPVDCAPARLVPAIRAMLGAKNTATLSPAAAALVRQVSVDPAPLRRALESLDRALTDEPDRAVLAAIRTAVRECQEIAPEQLGQLRQHIAIQCATADLNKGEVARAMGGAPREDAHFFRLFARTVERSGDAEDLVFACALWDQFRQAAVREGWFAPNGVETATLYLHMAQQVRKIPVPFLRALQHATPRDKGSAQNQYFLNPEELYQRACTLDPHREAFSEWMNWARQKSASAAERVATSWQKICPDDLEPVLYLMNAAAKRRAFPTALQHLARAERIDGVHPQVRRARLRLMVGGILRHLQQKKPHLAAEKVVALAALPEAQQGDRPAFIEAIRFFLNSVRGDAEGTKAARAAMERLLGGRIAANLWLFGVAVAAKQRALAGAVESPETLTPGERAGIPACLARVIGLARDLNSLDLQIPWTYIQETAAQLPASGASLNTAQLHLLAEAGVKAEHFDLAYVASSAGLERGGATEARFLLLRAQALPPQQFNRRALCAAAAAYLARQQRDMDLVEEATDLLSRPLRSADLVLTAEEAEEVLRREKAEPKSRGRNAPGPNYRELLQKRLCDCPDCRRARGEAVEPFEDDPFDDEPEDDLDLDEVFAGMPIPEDMPPEVAKMLFEETQRAVDRGESLDSLLSRFFGPGAAGSRKKRGK